MKLGLVAYAENTGLGAQTKAYYDHLQPALTMVLDRSASRDNTFYPDRFPERRMIVPGLPTAAECDAFLDAIDVLLLAETSPTLYLMRTARRRGIKIVLVPNYEYYFGFAAPRLPRPDLFLLPSTWHMDEYPDPKMYFPVPLTPKLAENLRKTATNFLHIAGRPIFPDRNGTIDVLECLRYVKSTVTVTIRCQVPAVLDHLIDEHGQEIPDNVTLVSDGYDYATTDELYADQDVLLMPRRFGGLCLPVNEAIERGMPVVMPDISPNGWLPKQWLIPAEQMGERKLANMVAVYDIDAEKLAAMIDAFATEPDWFATCRTIAAQMAQDYSWERLGPKLLDVLQSVLS